MGGIIDDSNNNDNGNSNGIRDNSNDINENGNKNEFTNIDDNCSESEDSNVGEVKIDDKLKKLTGKEPFGVDTDGFCLDETGERLSWEESNKACMKCMKR